MKNKVLLLLPIVMFSFTPHASAYLDPSLGIGTIGILLGLGSSLLLALCSILWAPIKRLLQIKKKRKKPNNQNNSPYDA